MWVTTLGLIAVSSLLVYIYFAWNNNYWNKNKVPHETPKFFFGNIKEVILGTEHFGIQYAELYKKFNNALYVGVYSLRSPAIIIRDPDILKNVLVKDFSSFANNDFQVEKEHDPILATNIFTQVGEEWKKNRNAWTASMTTSKIKNSFEKINSKCQTMIEYLKNDTKQNPNKPFETRELASSFFTDAIVTSIFGLEINSFEAKDNRFRKMVKSFFIPTIRDNLVTLSFAIMPKVAKFLKLRFVPKHVESELIRIANEIMETRKGNGFQKTNPFDCILLHGGNKATADLTEADIAGLIFGFLIDGVETSSGVCGFMLYELAYNLDVQKKLRNEINNVELNGGKLDYETIPKLQYLDMVLSETMRLYPPGLDVQRMCTKPYKLPPACQDGKEYEIPVGMSVIIPIYGLHMDPKYFPEPEKFDPERFNEENKKNIKKYSYLPFGEGPRACIGARFAVNQIKVCISNIIKNFEIRLSPETKEKPLKFDPNVITVRAIGDLWITLHNITEE